MEVLVDREDLAGADAHFAVDALEARRPRLQRGDADRVLVRHPEREVARGLGEQARRRAGRGGTDAVEAIEVEPRVRDVLPVDRPAHAFDDDLLRLDRKARPHALDERGDVRIARSRCAGGRGRRRLRRRGRRRRRGELGAVGDARRARARRRRVAAERAREAGVEGAPARGDADAAARDRLLERRPRERQRAAAGERAEEHGADDAARLVGDLRHVERDPARRRGLGDRGERAGVDAAVAERRLLADRPDPVRRRDQRRPVRRDEAALDGARRFHQLGGEDDVDVARHRHQRQHRRQAGRFGVGAREQLDVVDRRAGALGDARHRGRLGEVAVLLGELDDPVREDAAALAADGEDRDLDRLCAHRRAVRRRSARAGARRAAAARRSRPRAPGRGSDPSRSGC